MDQLVRGERMALVGEQEQVLGEQRLDDQLGIVHREMDHRRVQLAGQHARHERRRRAVLDDRSHVRVLLFEQAEELRHQPSRGRADHPDAALTRHHRVAAGHVGGDVVDLAQHPPGPLDDPRALLGQPAVGPIDERDAEFLLEPGDVAGDVRLHGEHRPCRAGERAVVGDGDQRGQLPDIHLQKR